MISEKMAWVVFPRSTPTGLLHQWRSQVGDTGACPPPPVVGKAQWSRTNDYSQRHSL